MERRGRCGPRGLHGLYDPLRRQEYRTRRSLELAALVLNSASARALVRWVLQLRGPLLMMQAASVRYWPPREEPQLLVARWSTQWEAVRARLL